RRVVMLGDAALGLAVDVTLAVLVHAVVEVAEDDGPRRAGCLAGGLDLTVADQPVLFFGLDAAAGNPLHAVGTLLHDPAAADGDLGVAKQTQAALGVIGVSQEVEAAHLVGAVVRAVPRTDTAVVDHVVETLAAVDRGCHRADQLAGGVFAVHAGDRLEI